MRKRVRQNSQLTLITLFLVAMVIPCIACLRETLDNRAVQWSTVIVEAKLEEIGKRVEVPTTGPLSQHIGGDYCFGAFVVSDVFDGDAKTGQTLRVFRSLMKPETESHCDTVIANAKVGDRFILLLQPTREKTAKIISGNWQLVHILKRAETDAAAIDDLRHLIRDVRADEASATDDAIDAQATALSVAQDDVEAEEAERALLRFGPKTLLALRTKLEDASVTDAGKTRLKRVIKELTP